MKEKQVDRIEKRSIKQGNLIMLLVVIFIFADVICENFIGIVYSKQPQIKENSLFIFFMLLQILLAPLQSGLSDRYGRKKSLIVSLSFSLLSLIFTSIFNFETRYLSLLIFATVAKGALGNTLPISLAVIADTQGKNYRLSFASATAAYAAAYLLLASASDLLSVPQINYCLIAGFILLVIYCSKKLYDFEDVEIKTIPTKNSSSLLSIFKSETELLKKDLRHSSTNRALAAFFLWEASLYIILVSQVDFQLNKSTHIAETMMIGYLFGVLILGALRKAKDSNIIKAGYFISFFSLVPYFILFKLISDTNSLIRVCYFFHALGNAFLSPALLSILAKERKPHEQGRMYGLADSIDTLGYLCATLSIIMFNMIGVELIYLISFSFITFSISWIFYSRFQNLKA